MLQQGQGNFTLTLFFYMLKNNEKNQGRTMHFKKLTALFALTLLAGPVYATENKLAKHITTLVDAKPILRVPPTYPIQEAKKSKEGWVIVSFVVDTNGKVSDAVVEDSSGSNRFERETLKALNKWKFQPATENGKAITQCKNSIRMDFKLHNSGTGVSKKFLRLHASFSEALEAKDAAKLSELATKLKNYKIYRGIESFYQHSALARYANFQQQPKQELYHLNKALHFSGEKTYRDQDTLTAQQKSIRANIEQNIYPALHKKLLLELDAGHVASAHRTTERLLALEISKPNHERYQKQKLAIEQFISGPDAITRQLNIKDRDSVAHRLARQSFGIQNVDGRLTKLDVRCRNKRHVYTVNEQSQWKLPKNWQGCSVYFYGEDSTSFTVVELPNA